MRRTAEASWRDADLCVVDLEMTGLDPARDEIVSWGTVPIRDGRARLGEARSGLVRPDAVMTPDAIRIHGLRPADLASQPSGAVALGPLFDALDGGVLVAHVARVERSFLRAAARSVGRPAPRVPLDTELLGRAAMRAAGVAPPAHLSLSALARWLDLPVHRAHEAQGDALTTAQIFLALAARVDQRSEQSVSSLTKLCRVEAWRRPLPFL